MEIENSPRDARYVLMFKDNPVCDVEYDVSSALVRSIERIENPELLPPRAVREGKANAVLLGSWWQDRFAPRDRLPRVLQHSPEFSKVFAASMGMSLSDHYWMKPADSAARWSELNFFDNPFSDEIGRDLLGTGKRSSLQDVEDLRSPSLTTNGALAKFWRIDPSSGKRQLCKSADPGDREALNEVAVSAALACFLEPEDFTPYWAEEFDGKAWSVCDSFLDGMHDFVPVYDAVPGLSCDEEGFDLLRRFAEEHGIEGFDKAVSQMFVVDALVANTDRHLGNFGFLRNADTLEYERFAPIFDSGRSLWCPASERRSFAPFARNVNEQLGLLLDVSWLDFKKLDKAPAAMREALTSLGIEASEADRVFENALYQSELVEFAAEEFHAPARKPAFEKSKLKAREAADASNQRRLGRSRERSSGCQTR